MPRISTGESVVGRAVRILEAFDDPDVSLRVAEAARRAGIPPATASRLISQLVEAGLIVRKPDRRVALGFRLWELGTRASPTLSLREAAMPVMEDLHSVLGQHLQLGVMDGDDVLYIERLSSPDAVSSFARLAGRRPLRASSAGLVLLAFAGREHQGRVLSGLDEGGSGDAQRLRRTLAGVRRDGYVITPGLVLPTISGIAVPICGRDGEVVAAMSLVTLRSVELRKHVPALLSAARGISRRLREGPGARARIQDPRPHTDAKEIDGHDD